MAITAKDMVAEVLEDHGYRFGEDQTGSCIHFYEFHGYLYPNMHMVRMEHWLNIKVGDEGSMSAWRMAFYFMMDGFNPWIEAYKRCDEYGYPKCTPFNDGNNLYNEMARYKREVLGEVFDDLMRIDWEE